MGEIRAVLWDFGGVILSSPFEAFARYEREQGLPEGLIRRLNATNPDTNAWARLERSEVDLAGFCELFEAEAAAAGHEVDGRAVIALLAGEVRPQMVEALRRIRARPLLLAMLTNNFVTGPDPTGDGVAERAAGRGARSEILDLFDVIVESSQVGVRKPDTRFYEIACEQLGIEPREAVFLDDLGVNLKPARAMGMTTIKVIDPDEALSELERVLGFPLG
jgi:putative hydrolase of the HAD superfamily